MSIGFTVPVVMLCQGPLSDTRSIVMIIVGFVLTGLFNTVSAYFLAFPVQCLLVRCDKQFWVDRETDVEDGEARRTPKLSKRFQSLHNTSPADSSVTVGSDPLGESSFEGDERAQQLVENTPVGIHRASYWHSLRSWAFRNPVLLLCWLFTFTLGLPLRYRAESDVILATFLLLSVWLTTLAIQTNIKHSPRLASWLRTLLSGLFNAVLWTSVTMIAYIFADSAISKRPLPAMLGALQSHTPLSTLIVRAASAAPPPPTPDPGTSTGTGSDAPPTLAAGDIAISILNSGLVAWGLKLYEYRGQVLSRGGLTVCTVSAVLALANTVCGPLFARHVLGVAPASRALAFAARSVTIALANPVMAMLGGDAGLNAAMVVGSGIVYQMGLGFGAGRWLEARVCGWAVRRWRLRPWDVEGGPTTTAVTATAGRERRVVEDGGGGDTAMGGQAAQEARHRANDPRFVAAGVTVGINAAAMGTAYLYETQNEAAPHAALSMIALGIMTVVFSSITPFARWIVDSMST
ncbi:uncharacterized protein B0T15DRAFT_402944 [Chaetomium strumarium]|uniref:LrgB-like protein n=1 Tax=Chaetomium strumarium TaxID=1170767 RepID=A0AAJ0GMI7_9PEZI|nr:hypothetical protein B0T15DRAFT_402944 [Chaetomium strumarium]